MIEENPYRINFYERYQKIIEEYNNGKDYKAVKEIFDKLIDEFKKIAEEEKRGIRESLNEDELAVFDMLGKNKKINDKEKAELKNTARKLLKRLKNKEFKVEYWPDKVQTAAAVRATINDYLFQYLPHPVYDNNDITMKIEILYDFFKARYSNFASVAAINM